MTLGGEWTSAETSFNEPLFDTVDHFGVTVHVLDGDWKPPRRRYSKWAIGESPKAVDIQVVDGKWRIDA